MKARHILSVLIAGILVALGVVAVYYLDNFVVTLIAYALVFLIVLLKTLFAKESIHAKLLYFLLYGVVLAIQIVFLTLAVYFNPASPPWMKAVAAALLGLPFLVELLFRCGCGCRNMMPSFQEFTCVSFAQLGHDKERLQTAIKTLQDTGKALSRDNLSEILRDLPRHNSSRYINDGSLTNAYFEEAERHVDDGFLYLVLTDSGTAANNIISVFTHRSFNHASLSLDRDLQTIISYNGGLNVYSPGLNPEMVKTLGKNKGSSIMVYRLAATRGQKRCIIEKIREINTEGSAYNLLGLVFKYTRKPNIMFCSQFVYTMLKHAGLNYFQPKRSTDVRPSDFVEMDYYRKLNFECEIRLTE